MLRVAGSHDVFSQRVNCNINYYDRRIVFLYIASVAILLRLCVMAFEENNPMLLVFSVLGILTILGLWWRSRRNRAALIEEDNNRNEATTDAELSLMMRTFGDSLLVRSATNRVMLTDCLRDLKASSQTFIFHKSLLQNPGRIESDSHTHIHDHSIENGHNDQVQEFTEPDSKSFPTVNSTEIGTEMGTEDMDKQMRSSASIESTSATALSSAPAAGGCIICAYLHEKFPMRSIFRDRNSDSVSRASSEGSSSKSTPPDQTVSSTQQLNLSYLESACCVCLCEYEEGDLLSLLPCLHILHEHCVIQWVECRCRTLCLSNNRSDERSGPNGVLNGFCPICKQSVDRTIPVLPTVGLEDRPLRDTGTTNQTPVERFDGGPIGNEEFKENRMDEIV